MAISVVIHCLDGPGPLRPRHSIHRNGGPSRSATSPSSTPPPRGCLRRGCRPSGSYLCLGALRALTGYRSAVRRNAPPRSDVDVVPSGGASDADVVDVTPRRGRRRLQSDAPAVAPDRGPAFEPQLLPQSGSIGPERPRGVDPPLWPQDPGVLRPLAEELGRSAPAMPHELGAEAATGPGTLAEAGPAATAPAEGRGGRRGRAGRRRRRVVVGEESLAPPLPPVGPVSGSVLEPFAGWRGGESADRRERSEGPRFAVQATESRMSALDSELGATSAVQASAELPLAAAETPVKSGGRRERRRRRAHRFG